MVDKWYAKRPPVDKMADGIYTNEEVKWLANYALFLERKLYGQQLDLAIDSSTGFEVTSRLD